ncbi:lactoperoxidase-like [Dendronephthya gigantea]|uniref:lactoperoxidase-like n=1 Tax=Dendronephthya gigantea TaxID=151771 RepID=UPI00106CFC5D|nr:lactoperoxidase-like [Dendronephthya gigantea]
MANTLHRIMRMTRECDNPTAYRTNMASAMVREALTQVIDELVAKFVTIPGVDGKVISHLSLNTLFTSASLNSLASKTECYTPKANNCDRNSVYRTIDGKCNNLNNPLFGSASTALTRFLPAQYFDLDGLNDPIGLPGQVNVPDIPATFKVVRDFIVNQEKYQELNTQFSHMFMQYGQFLDHDLDLSPEIENSDRCMNTRCDGSKGDFVEPCYTILPLEPCYRCIHFSRSATVCPIDGNGRITKRQQINVNTAFVDGSQIYGSDEKLAKSLRDLKNGKGLLRTGTRVQNFGDFLPDNDCRLTFPSDLCRLLGGCFLAGDGRTSEQMALACMHTLFLREHNRIAEELGRLNPSWNGDKIYNETRKIVGAVLQKITYEDFLPIIIGDSLPTYNQYDPSVNPGILNSFATAAFRFGHSLIRPTFDRLDKGFNPTGKPILLREMFFNNTFIRKNDIDQLLLGLLGNESQIVDRKIANGILNHLFERPNSPGLNLAALNIQRGRDHGLPGYNAFRGRCSLKNANSFQDTANEIRNPRNRKLLSQLYKDDPDLADLWVAGLAEAPISGGTVGETFACIIREQMRRVRDGDRFFYMNNVFSNQQLQEIRKASLSKIMCDNLKNIVSVQPNAFMAGSQRKECSQIPGIDLSAWKGKTVTSCATKTSDGRCCVFPFTYKNKKYTSCKQSDVYAYSKWCATSSTYVSGNNWGYCQVKPCATKTFIFDGRCCVFPFTYKNKKYTSCKQSDIYANRKWCATSSTYVSGNNWGYCQATG